MADHNEVAALTIKEYISGVSPIISDEVVRMILADRGVAEDAEIQYVEEKDKDLLRADALLWCAMSPSTNGGWEEQVGNWKTKKAGNTLTSADKSSMKRMARYLYRKWGIPFPYPSSVQIVKKGMMI